MEYNSCRHCRAELENWYLYVCDYASEDSASDILVEFSRAHLGKVSLLMDKAGRIGVCANFARLMEAVTKSYIAFSGQDDIWRTDKLVRAVAVLPAPETEGGAVQPRLVHADRRVISGYGIEIEPSYWCSRGLGSGVLQLLSGGRVRSP